MKEIKYGKRPALITDFIIGINAVKVARAARKQGVSGLRITPVKVTPLVDLACWSWIPEYLLPFPEGTKEAVKSVITSLDSKVQHRLAFGPDSGEWVERVHFWQEVLKPALTSQQYSAAILVILDWAKRCVQCRLGLRSHPWIDKQEG